MGKRSYNGGSSVVGPGASYFRSHPDDGDAPREIDAELLAIMAEHDKLRLRGRNPMTARKRKKPA